MELEFCAVTGISQAAEMEAIEMEPRTLSEIQLQEAREAAVDILQQKPPEEALSIFTEGLRPVRSVKEMEKLKINAGKKRALEKPQSFMSTPNPEQEVPQYHHPYLVASASCIRASAPF